MNAVISETNLEASRLLATDYDAYLNYKGATRSYLYLEEQLILNQIQAVPETQRRVALDLGCGTGRATQILSQSFSETIAVDISVEMLMLAKEKRYVNRTHFIQYNFNYSVDHLIAEEKNYDLVCASFGVGSCIEKLTDFLDKLLPKVNAHTPIILSLYNKNYHPIHTTEQCFPFASLLDAKQNAVLVSHEDKQIKINIQTYNLDELKHLLSRYQFSYQQYYFLPTLSGLIQSDLLSDNGFWEKVVNIDKTLLSYNNTVSAPYILLILKR